MTLNSEVKKNERQVRQSVSALSLLFLLWPVHPETLMLDWTVVHVHRPRGEELLGVPYAKPQQTGFWVSSATKKRSKKIN